MLPPCKSMCSATASKRGRVLSAAATKRRRMRQSKRQAQVCEPVVISSNEDMGEVCNLEKDMKMLIFRYLSLEYSLCSLFIITMHFLLLQIYHHHAFSPSTDLSSPCIFSFYRFIICLIVEFLLLPLPWRYATDSGLNYFVLISRKCGGTCTTVWRMG